MPPSELPEFFGVTNSAALSSEPVTLESLQEAMHKMRAMQAAHRKQQDESLAKMKPCGECWERPKMSEDGNGIEMCDTYYRQLLRHPKLQAVGRMSPVDRIMGLRMDVVPCIPPMKFFDAAISPPPT